MSNIEWTGETWNPVAGCSLASPGCTNCYAMQMAARLARMGQAKYEGLTRKVKGRDVWTGEVRLSPDDFGIPLKRKKPTTYFVNSMSDLFHENLTNEQIAEVFKVICQSLWHRPRENRHTYQILTKRAERLPEWFRWAQGQHSGWFGFEGQLDLGKVWIGVSVEDRARLSRIDHLRQVPTHRRFLSIEPLLEDLGPLDLSGIGWVIVGGESGQRARPCGLGWIRRVVRQCQDAGVPVFVKQLGACAVDEKHGIAGARLKVPQEAAPLISIRLKDFKGGDLLEWPEDLRIRQMPAAAP